ncbi:hypothetical protein [Vulcanisaeta souniana]|uniref:Restriction endonuclease type IV Mrr domain-containing protein n=1 Tax=Vulcanisaeta souniana JCM 11219 TaxID=1293586 RepID=A0A830EFM9_9CREN|nr:hypothetical protein [Vulcanisaeta souniana]BDR93178.1 hypothetical protein Vsou_22710 [Vulcanisaeta souniana JCM 11219]GGI78235.1 hypothetical protein GCM10007112_13800 [Vulcanisaeta souniana JCM 11219]
MSTGRERLVRALIALSGAGVFTLDALRGLSGVGDSMISEFVDSLINDGVLSRVGESYRSNMPPHRLIRYFVGRGIYVDLESISGYLPWDEFEALIRLVFEEWGFNVVSRLRVPVVGTRVEFDVIAYRRPRVFLIEAKRWKRASSSIRRIVGRHLEKVGFVAREPEVLMSRVGIGWGEALLIPVVITWHRALMELIDGVPVVSIYQVNSFINELDGIIDSIRLFRVSWRHV